MGLKKIKNGLDNGVHYNGPLFLAKDGNTWPTSWYFFQRKEYKYSYSQKNLRKYKYILTTTDDDEAQKILEKSHRYRDISYRSWYLPRYERFSLFDFFHYWWNFSTQDEIGVAKLRLFLRSQ